MPVFDRSLATTCQTCFFCLPLSYFSPLNPCQGGAVHMPQFMCVLEKVMCTFGENCFLRVSAFVSLFLSLIGELWQQVASSGCGAVMPRLLPYLSQTIDLSLIGSSVGERPWKAYCWSKLVLEPGDAGCQAQVLESWTPNWYQWCVQCRMASCWMVAVDTQFSNGNSTKTFSTSWGLWIFICHFSTKQKFE